MAHPDPSPILDLIEAFRRSKVMFSAVSLGVFDLLESGPQELAQVAEKLDTPADPLERLLDACVGLKLLRRISSVYENEPVASAYLCRSSPTSLAGYILYSDSALFRLWAHLEDAIRENGPRWQQAFGTEGAIFDHFFRSPDAKNTFLQGMHGLGTLSSPAVVAAFPLARFRKMIDLGGGTGHLAIAACEKYPDLRATVFDLAQVIEVTRVHIAKSNNAQRRVDVMGGDFFQDALPEGDLFGLGRIVHDWPESRVRPLLAKIFQRLAPGGAILLAEKLLKEDKSGPISAQLQSLNMLVCTEGKERTLSEYRRLLEEAGFSAVQGKVTGAPVDAIFAVKPASDTAKLPSTG